jgi:hypothetical protein
MKIVAAAKLLTVSKVRSSMPAWKLSAKTGTAQNKTKATIKRFTVPPIAGKSYAPNTKSLSMQIEVKLRGFGAHKLSSGIRICSDSVTDSQFGEDFTG